MRTYPLSIDPTKRVQTGPVTFGNDWPGIFIRGDEALGMANSLKLLAKHYSIPDGQGSLINGWVEMLTACRAE